MELTEYSGIVQQWIQQVYDNRLSNAEITLKCCQDIIAYGMKTDDSKLLGFGYFYLGETYYCLNDGDNFQGSISRAISYLDTAGEWDLLAQCYNYLGISAMNSGNAPIALDYYLKGVSHCKKYGLNNRELLLTINIAALDISYERYSEAQEFLEHSLSYMQGRTQDKDYYTWMNCIYNNLGKCLVLQNKFERIPDFQKTIQEEYWPHLDELDKLTFYMMETLYYHRVHNFDKRDERIDIISQVVPKNMTILEIFDDILDYCLVLLDACKEDAFWQMVDILEPMVKNFRGYNLQIRVLSLKMKYFRKYNRNADYLRSAGLFYEMTEMMERENMSMISNQMNVRSSLELANNARREMEIKNQLLREKSEKDPLTGMANRFKLNDYSEEAFERAYSNGTTLAVEMLDIDYFKEYNDNYGHQAGDQCIISIANAIKEVCEKHNGFCARYGGDEFIIIYEGITQEEAFRCEAELKKRIAELGIEHKYSKAIPMVTLSQGMCWDVPQKQTRMWDFLHAADSMLYKIKKVTRNNYCLNTMSGDDADIQVGPA